MTARQPKPVPSTYAWPCLVLSVDPGAEMGVAVCKKGEPVLAEAEWSAEHMGALVASATIPIIAVIEHHTPHGRWGLKQFRTMQRRVGQATRDVENAGIPEHHIAFVEPNVWQGALGFGGKLRSAERKRAAKQRALSYKGVAERYATDKLSYDVADAICIGVWGSFSAEVGAILAAITVVDAKLRMA